MIESYIEESLKDINLEAYYLYRPDELQECIVYSYTMKSAIESDNEIKAYEYTVLLNAYVTTETDITLSRISICEAMQRARFRVQPVPAPNREKDFINIPLKFKIVK